MRKSTKTPSSVLVSLMDEYGLNPNTLAKELGLSYSAVRMITLGNIKVSAPTALRLSEYFGNTPEFWLSLQQEADLAEAGKDKNLQSALKSIKRAVKKPAKTKAAVKPRRKTTLSDKRKAAKKVPGAKPASRTRRKKL
jgi:antitoxin HigA-1